MERIVRIFANLEEADRADREAYARLDPQQRVDILLELIERYRSSLGQPAERLERVCRVAQLDEG